jgi:hypothetical protein
MREGKTGTERSRFQLSWHRRVGLTSFACLLFGTLWLSSAVLPGLQRSTEQEAGKLAGSGVGVFQMLSVLNRQPTPKETPIPEFSPSPATPAIGTVEVALANAPIGSALQLLLASARFSCTVDPAVTGVVTYSCAGKGKPFWEVLGRVIGASPEPGVHVAAIWDSYRVLPRSVKPTRMRDYSPAPVPEPSPLPFGNGPATHRMVGYVSLKSADDQPAVASALMETRIPGLPPQWRMVRVGEVLQRKSSLDTARETDAKANVDVAVVVTEVAADHLTIRGGGDKSLRVPLSVNSVPDVFGFSSMPPASEQGNGFATDNNPRVPGGWNK